MPFIATTDREACHRLHLLALRGEAPLLSPAYARSDRDLRRAAGAPALRSVPSVAGDVAAQLDPGAPPPTEDAAWFARRWESGAATTNASLAATLAQAANTLPAAALLPVEPVEVLVSEAVGGAAAWTRPWRAVAGPRAPAALLVIATVAAALREDLPLPALSPKDAETLRLHLAATALIRLPELSGHVDTLLQTAGVQLLPMQGRRLQAVKQLRRLNAAVLDQPPGEVERIGAGFHRDRTDRLHRAWVRGFFVPRGFDLDGWLAARRASR